MKQIPRGMAQVRFRFHPDCLVFSSKEYIHVEIANFCFLTELRHV